MFSIDKHPATCSSGALMQLKNLPPLSARLIFFCLLIFSLAGCFCPHRYAMQCEPEPLQPFYVKDKIRVALVLGSGGIRGIAHVGVLEELEAAGIPIDLIVGCSAGSLVGALYAAHPCVEEIMPVVWQIRSSSIFDLDLWNCRFGLSQDYCMKQTLKKYLHAQTFEELQIPLVIVATDLHTGELVPIGAGNLPKAVQASCSIPFVFVPCEHLGRIFVDGGVVDPIPAKVARDLGADLVIAVDLCELLPKSCPSNLFQIANRSAEIACMWQNEACTQQADFVIRPKTCGAGTFNDTMKWQVYDAGKQAAHQQMPEIIKAFAKLSNEQTCGMRLVNLPCYSSKIYLSPD